MTLRTDIAPKPDYRMQSIDFAERRRVVAVHSTSRTLGVPCVRVGRIVSVVESGVIVLTDRNHTEYHVPIESITHIVDILDREEEERARFPLYETVGPGLVRPKASEADIRAQREAAAAVVRTRAHPAAEDDDTRFAVTPAEG